MLFIILSAQSKNLDIGLTSQISYTMSSLLYNSCIARQVSGISPENEWSVSPCEKKNRFNEKKNAYLIE